MKFWFLFQLFECFFFCFFFPSIQLSHRSQAIVDRYVAQGRSVLQPHHLLDEMTSAVDENKAANIKDSAFGKLLQNCQVSTIPCAEVEYCDSRNYLTSI